MRSYDPKSVLLFLFLFLAIMWLGYGSTSLTTCTPLLFLVFFLFYTSTVRASALVPECSELPASLLSCTFNTSCRYGVLTDVPCNVTPGIRCMGERTFDRSFVCRFCYQTPSDVHECIPNTSCSSGDSRVLVQCHIQDDVMCIGSRSFPKMVTCNFARNSKHSIAIALSVLAGGLGVDRFYLGYTGLGFAKLLTFGGLGVWTVLDAILIAAGYVRPSDGSVYL